MSEKKLKLVKDDFISSAIGKDAYNLLLDKPLESAKVLESGLSELKVPCFVTCKRPLDDLPTINLLIQNGFQLVEVAITLDKNLYPTPWKLKNDEFQVVTATVADLKACVDIANKANWKSRFHEDSLLGKTEIPTQIKVRWIENGIRGIRGNGVFLVKNAKGECIGFNMIILGKDEEHDLAIIDLIATHPDYESQGVAQALMADFVARFGNTHILRVGTQAINKASLHLYKKFGFEVSYSTAVLHYHKK